MSCIAKLIDAISILLIICIAEFFLMINYSAAKVIRDFFMAKFIQRTGKFYK